VTGCCSAAQTCWIKLVPELAQRVVMLFRLTAALPVRREGQVGSLVPISLSVPLGRGRRQGHNGTIAAT
jgi:hypothetical protein